MAGLNLRGSLGVTGALPPSSSPSSISEAAYGASVASGNVTGRKTAGFGTIGVAMAATAVLAWMWWSLPR